MANTSSHGKQVIIFDRQFIELNGPCSIPNCLLLFFFGGGAIPLSCKFKDKTDDNDVDDNVLSLLLLLLFTNMI